MQLRPSHTELITKLWSGPSNLITYQQVGAIKMQSVTALSKQENEEVGRNFNNLSLETSFPPPSKSNDKTGARSQLRDPFPATNATARLRWHHDAFPVYGDELQELHFAGRIEEGTTASERSS
jgi:hypothetical protein